MDQLQLGIDPGLDEQIKEKFRQEYEEKIRIAVEEELMLEAIKDMKKKIRKTQ